MRIQVVVAVKFQYRNYK